MTINKQQAEGTGGAYVSEAEGCRFEPHREHLDIVAPVASETPHAGLRGDRGFVHRRGSLDDFTVGGNQIVGLADKQVSFALGKKTQG